MNELEEQMAETAKGFKAMNKRINRVTKALEDIKRTTQKLLDMETERARDEYRSYWELRSVYLLAKNGLFRHQNTILQKLALEQDG